MLARNAISIAFSDVFFPIGASDFRLPALREAYICNLLLLVYP
jgi:hypothetical protein